ncbi:MAG: DUF3732 domain-containing protein, partial [Chlorobiales bacterium]|nr:DUF3732 domain-containing protein [Chlorobiales bacterium]
VKAKQRRDKIERARSEQIHPTDYLRNELRCLSAEIENIHQAIADSAESITEQRALHAELITAKTKSDRANHAKKILDGVHYQRCPECGSDISERPDDGKLCHLCGSTKDNDTTITSAEQEAMRRDINDRIDQIADSIDRRVFESNRMKRKLEQTQRQKATLDKQLQEKLARYDSAFVESIRSIEREIATLEERINSIQKLQLMPKEINALEEQAGSLQGRIDRLRTSINEERDRLNNADANITEIAVEFKRVMLSISFPGLSDNDKVEIDPQNWKPIVVHGDQEWTFWDTGSGGKKTLFNVCYALALHSVAIKRGMPVPDILIIDSPTKNISEDENPELVKSLYAEIYRLAGEQNGRRLQFLMIDSDLVRPTSEQSDFVERRMAGEPDAPSLIPYYTGP